MTEDPRTSRAIAEAAWSSIGGDPAALSRLHFAGTGGLASIFAVTDLASASVGVAALAIAELITAQGAAAPRVVVDRRLASMWFGFSIRPAGWQMPASWDPIAGDYPTSDGWIRLHTNAPHHRAAAQRVLGPHADRVGIARAVERWCKRDLEAAVVAAGGCAAEMLTVAQWQGHPQGSAVTNEPLVHFASAEGGGASLHLQSHSRPLEGLRVLDLTRVLAGPVASRFLAGFGADVLRIDPFDWDEPGVVPEVTLGKRCAGLDLKDADGRARFEALLSSAHVLLHGYRRDALERLGYDTAARRRIAPGLVDVALNAYGWSGPWTKRRGFDSLLQISTGIADAGMRSAAASKPVPLPVQALDQATGYLMAAAAISGVMQRVRHGSGSEARLSLARTAKLLIDTGDGSESLGLAAELDADLADAIEVTAWGNARRLVPPAIVDGAPMHWSLPASNLRSAEPVWIDGA